MVCEHILCSLEANSIGIKCGQTSCMTGASKMHTGKRDGHCQPLGEAQNSSARKKKLVLQLKETLQSFLDSTYWMMSVSHTIV